MLPVKYVWQGKKQTPHKKYAKLVQANVIRLLVSINQSVVAALLVEIT
jgi:hypothetical protein